MSPSDDSTRPISVAELLARNGTIGAPPVSGRRRRRRGNDQSVTVAELTGEIPVIRAEEIPVAVTEAAEEPIAEEPIAEVPVSEESVYEESVYEEPAAEEEDPEGPRRRQRRERAERRGGQAAEQDGVIGERDIGQRPCGCQFERCEFADALLQVCGDSRIAAEQHHRVCMERLERERDAAGHPLVPQRPQAARGDLPGLMRLRHAGHEKRERL
jgi:hypothetical protein